MSQKKYSYAFGDEVVSLFLSAHPAGWEWVAQVFYLREEHIIEIFRSHQKVWWEFKKAVKYYDALIGTARIPARILYQEMPPRLQALWTWLKQADYDYTDALDPFAYPFHHQPRPSRN